MNSAPKMDALCVLKLGKRSYHVRVSSVNHDNKSCGVWATEAECIRLGVIDRHDFVTWKKLTPLEVPKL